MTGFLEQFFPETIGSEGTQAGDLYCTYNNQKIQWFTSSLFLAGAATELSGTTGQPLPMHAASLNAACQPTGVCSLVFLRRVERRDHHRPALIKVNSCIGLLMHGNPAVKSLHMLSSVRLLPVFRSLCLSICMVG